MRYARTAPPVYHDEDALTVCLEALGAVRRAFPSGMALPAAEDQAADAWDMLIDLEHRLTLSRETCRTEIVRIEAAEVSA